MLRTERHPIASYLRSRQIDFHSLDRHYETAQSFEDAYRAAAREVLDLAKEKGEVVYAAPGHPFVGETVSRLLVELGPGEGVSVEVSPSVSFLDVLFAVLRLDPLAGLQVLDAFSLENAEISTAGHLVVGQVYHRHLASEVKLHLLHRYPADHPVTIVYGQGAERLVEVPLAELDRQEFDHMTSVYVPPARPVAAGAFQRSVELMARLRGPGGCPWDREQDHLSLRRHLLEEAHEVLEAVEEGRPEELREELGDLMLQILFHAQIEAEEGHFTIYDSLDVLNDKLVRRHPHIFGEVEVSSSAEVVANWERIKRREKGRRSYLDGVPHSLPALLYAQQIQAKAARIGFDWPHVGQVFSKLEEELGELREALDGKGDISQEIGDVLFTVINLARHQEVDTETALRDTVRRFRRRFLHMERIAEEEKERLEDLPLARLDRLWEVAKQEEA